MSEITEFQDALKGAIEGLRETAEAFLVEDTDDFMHTYTIGARDFIAYLVDGSTTPFLDKLIAKIDKLTAAKEQANGS